METEKKKIKSNFRKHGVNVNFQFFNCLFALLIFFRITTLKRENNHKRRKHYRFRSVVLKFYQENNIFCSRLPNFFRRSCFGSLDIILRI